MNNEHIKTYITVLTPYYLPLEIIFSFEKHPILQMTISKSHMKLW